jgi:hypothetical protein
LSNKIERNEIKSFRVPKYLVRSGAIQHLSADGLRLFLFVIYEIYARRVEEVSFHLLVLHKGLGVLRSQLKPLAEELVQLGLLICDVFADDERIVFRLPDVEPT